ncbi:alpha/beta fold hydrolase [Flavicella sediminum]|uniref:alpha/beta fold hydrolase n=1 Tax=Flavicella sediminum TaxID=2585141 RepID=UPI00111CC71A|nr:alpha/beta fold hydrolase [Flavicella sediminum]
MQLLHSKIQGTGQPLLILHGYFGMGDNWKSQANNLSKKYEVHLIDQRNHGRSFHSDDFDYELLVEDLKNYVAHYKLESVHLLGHSMGGKTAMLFAVSYPEKVKSLLVADIAPKNYPPHHHQILEALNAVDFSKIKLRNEVDAVLKNYINEEGVRQFLLKNIYRKTKTELAFRFNLESLTENNSEVGEPLPAFAEFDGPTLFLKGGNSGYIAAEDEGQIKAHFSDSEIVTVKNAGHWLHAENPSDFLKEVEDFLSKHN